MRRVWSAPSAGSRSRRGPLSERERRGPPSVPVCAQLQTQKASPTRRKVWVGDVPLPETVAACACQISMGESRSNNATQNIARAAVSCIADITVHVQSMCMKQVQYLSVRILFFLFFLMWEHLKTYKYQFWMWVCPAINILTQYVLMTHRAILLITLVHV